MAWSQAALVLSHGHTAPVYGPGRQAGACARDAGAAHPATLAAQPGTGDTLTNEKSGLRGVPLRFPKRPCQGASGLVSCVGHRHVQLAHERRRCAGPSGESRHLAGHSGLQPPPTSLHVLLGVTLCGLACPRALWSQRCFRSLHV